MLIQAANDYSIAPSQELADELRRLHKSYVLKIYPPVGRTADDGHNVLYLGFLNGSAMSSDSDKRKTERVVT